MDREDRVRAILEPLLAPGESVRWAVKASGSSGVRPYLGQLLTLALFFFGFAAMATWMMWPSNHPEPVWVTEQRARSVPRRNARSDTRQNARSLPRQPTQGLAAPPPLPESSPWTPAIFFGSFGMVAMGLITGLLYAFGRATVYGVTDRRLLIVQACQPRSFKLDELAFLDARERTNGAGDLLFMHQAGGNIGIGSPGSFMVSRPTRSNRSGFLGVPDVREVETLVRELQSQAAPSRAADPAIASTQPDAAFAAHEILTPRPADPDTDVPLDTRPRTYGYRSVPFAMGCIGVPFVIMGTGFMVPFLLPAIGLAPASVGEATPGSPSSAGANGQFIGIIIGGVFAAIGWGMLLWRSYLELDPAQGTFRVQRGFVPFAPLRTGSFADIERLDVRSERRSNQGSSWQVWIPSLFWKSIGSKKPLVFPLGEYRDEVQAGVEAQRLGSLLQIPVRTVPGASPRAAQRVSGAVPAKPAPRWPRYVLPGIVVAVFGNSLFGGLHWRDEWTDEAGNHYVRQSTLVHTVINAVSPTGEHSYKEEQGYLFGSSSSSSGFLTQNDSGPGHGYRWSLGWGRFAPDRAAVYAASTVTVTPQEQRLQAIVGQIEAYANARKWPQAARAAKAIADGATGMNPSRYNGYAQAAALAQLRAGDLTGYRRTCQALASNLPHLSTPYDLNLAAWICALAPGAVQDYAPVVRASERAVSFRADHANLNTLGLLLCRAGRYREAIARIQEGLKHPGQPDPSDWMSLGLAYQGLRDTHQARVWLKKAVDAYATPPAATGASSAGVGDWKARAERDILAREARAAFARSRG